MQQVTAHDTLQTADIPTIDTMMLASRVRNVWVAQQVFELVVARITQLPALPARMDSAEAAVAYLT